MKSEMNYAYAVARTRAVENRLLDASVIEQLVTAPGLSQAVKVLQDKGWEVKDGDFSQALNEQLRDAWVFLNEAAPDGSELEVLTVQNDYHNLKAAIKCIFSGFNRDDCYMYPTKLDLEALGKAADSRDFSLLPEHMQQAAEEAYDIAAETENGQKTDMVIDNASLRRLSELSKQLGCGLMQKIANLLCATADIKSAVRCARTGKDSSFIKRALCPCDGLDLSLLSEAASEGEQSVLEYVGKTAYSAAAEALTAGSAAFEKWCDDEQMKLIKTAKWQAFGLEPLIAYYYAKSAEIKTVRTVLGAKQGGMAADKIRERVRELYV